MRPRFQARSEDAATHTLIAGTETTLTGLSIPGKESFAELLVSVPHRLLRREHRKIQRNIVAERVLQLPKEPRFDADTFSNLGKN